MKKSYYTDPNKQRGGQPVRVLYDKIEIWFKNVYPQFETTELKEAIEKFGLYDEIYVIEREEKIGTPAYIGTFKRISVQESFLSYLWSMSYSLIFIYDKTIHEPRTISNHVLSPAVIGKAKKAQELFNYGLSLLKNYNPWDLENLPNPEYYDSENDEYIAIANGVYLQAVNFVVMHELGHLLLGHIDKDIESEENGVTISNEIRIQDEIEADNFSVERLFKHEGERSNGHTISVGLIAALCSFIFFSTNLKGQEHPDPDQRLKMILERLNLKPEDNLWGISCLAFKLWSMNNNINLGWPIEVETYRDLFYVTLEELNGLKDN